MNIIVRQLGQQDYQSVWQAMRTFTEQRTERTEDELWLVEHFPVFTQGQAGKAEHILQANDIPIVQTDRGGQVTYHGPGQLVVYVLLDLKRAKMGIRQLVTSLEQAVIELLTTFGIQAHARRDAPGVYVEQAKIGAVGLRVRHGCCYHGLALNVDLDLQPFSWINPCGFADLSVTQISDFVEQVDVGSVAEQLIKYLMSHLD